VVLSNKREKEEGGEREEGGGIKMRKCGAEKERFLEGWTVEGKERWAGSWREKVERQGGGGGKGEKKGRREVLGKKRRKRAEGVGSGGDSG